MLMSCKQDNKQTNARDTGDEDNIESMEKLTDQMQETGTEIDSLSAVLDSLLIELE